MSEANFGTQRIKGEKQTKTTSSSNNNNKNENNRKKKKYYEAERTAQQQKKNARPKNKQQCFFFVCLQENGLERKRNFVNFSRCIQCLGTGYKTGR